MVKLNKQCICCKTKYTYCPSCSRADSLKPTWYSDFCSETCMTLWTTATKYNMSMLTKPEAKSIISALDLKPIDTYAACIQRDYANIMEPVKKPRRTPKKPEPVIEVQPEAIVAPVAEDAESREVVLKENE